MRSYYNQALVTRLLRAFERRFVRVDEGTLYVARDGGAGVRLPDADAARLIALVRAEMAEADAENPDAGPLGIPSAIGVGLLAIIGGTIAGFEDTALALFAPLVAIVVLAGPVLGLVRLHARWQGAVARFERLMQGYREVPADEVRARVAANPARPAVLVVLLFTGAILTGLAFAAYTSPPPVRYAIDRWVARITPAAVLLIGLLAAAAALVDALTRRRIPEAEIARAVEERSTPLR